MRKNFIKRFKTEKVQVIPCSNKHTTEIPSKATKRAKTTSSISLLKGREQYFQIQQ